MSALGVAPVDSDDCLVAAARRGDDRAFGELYSRYGGRIVSYAFGMVGDHGRAEDVAQEVFISALRRMRATERPIAFKPWIYEIARNACIDEFRRTRRAREVPLSSGGEPDSSGRVLESHAGSPHAALERRQQLDDLRGAFRGLSESHHKIIVLRELEGLSSTEIGRRMGMTRPVVESTLFRARRRLGAEYGEIASGRRCEQVHAVIDAGGETAVRALGLRERRRVARHVAHCQPCRRYARLAGVDDSVLKGPGLVEKIAALLPIPGLLRAPRGGAGDKAATASGHSGRLLQSTPTLARFVDPACPLLGLGRTAAAIIVAAVVGGGVVGSLATVGGARTNGKPKVAAAHASSRPGAGSSGSSGHAQIAAPWRSVAALAKATHDKSGGGTAEGGKSQPRTTQPTGSSTTSNTSAATQSHDGAAAGGSRQTTKTTNTGNTSSTGNTTGSSQTSGSNASPKQAPASTPSLPQVPQLPTGQSGSTRPSPPPVSTSQLPQLPNPNLPSPPSPGNLIDTTHKLVP